MKKIILNNDDLGISSSVNDATLELYKLGIIKSATLLVCAPKAKEISKEFLNDDFSLGVHFSLTIFEPLTNGLKHCVENNSFKKIDFLRFGREIIKEEVGDIENEFRAQLKEFINITGKLPSHIDSHHHIHKIGNVGEAIENIAKELNIKIRDVGDKKITSLYHPTNLNNYNTKNVYEFITILNGVPECCDIMTHVATSNDLSHISSYNENRVVEYNFLKEHHEFLKCNFKFISYKEI